MAKSSLRKYSIEEFDADLLERLTREGRVYVNFPRKQHNLYRNEILDYVARINEYVSEEWEDKIDWLWDEILDSDCLVEFLTMKKGNEAGHINRYAVTNLVCRMQNRGVYRNDVTMTVLHLKMENTNRKNKYYTSCGNYTLSQDAKQLLNSFFKSII